MDSRWSQRPPEQGAPCPSSSGSPAVVAPGLELASPLTPSTCGSCDSGVRPSPTACTFEGSPALCLEAEPGAGRAGAEGCGACLTPRAQPPGATDAASDDSKTSFLRAPVGPCVLSGRRRVGHGCTPLPCLGGDQRSLGWGSSCDLVLSRARLRRRQDLGERFCISVLQCAPHSPRPPSRQAHLKTALAGRLQPCARPDSALLGWGAFRSTLLASLLLSTSASLNPTDTFIDNTARGTAAATGAPFQLTYQQEQKSPSPSTSSLTSLPVDRRPSGCPTRPSSSRQRQLRRTTLSSMCLRPQLQAYRLERV